MTDSQIKFLSGSVLELLKQQAYALLCGSRKDCGLKRRRKESQ